MPEFYVLEVAYNHILERLKKNFGGRFGSMSQTQSSLNYKDDFAYLSAFDKGRKTFFKIESRNGLKGQIERILGISFTSISLEDAEKLDFL